MKRISFCFLLCILTALPLGAQGFLDRFTAQVGAGVSLPVATTNDHAGTGFNIQAAALLMQT
jgi:hypothetical protein